MEVKVDYYVCNIKRIPILNEDVLKITSETYLNRLKLLLCIFKCSLCGEYNYPESKFEEIIGDLIRVLLQIYF